ncbi:MAG: cation:proton antiporter [Bacillota bacterium]
MNPFIGLGVALISGILCGQFINRFKVPAVAGYIAAGLIIGISGLKIVDNEMIEQLSFLSDFALGIIAFNIGSEFKIPVLKKLGKSIFVIAACEALGAFILVTGIMLLLKQDMATALILGAVSSATAPAATVMVLKEYNAKGPLTSTLLGVVAVDDAICLIIYAVASSVAKVFVKHEAVTLSKILFHPMMEIVGSILLGVLCGILLAFLIQKSKKEVETLSFTLGSILFLVGLALQLQLSPLLSAMALGVTIANVSSQSRRAFSTIENFSPPIIAAFFTLAGARLDITLLPRIGLIGIAYILFRTAGKVFGASLGGKLSNASDEVRKYIGLGLLSQVGVAIGLAIVVGREFPNTELASLVITTLLATTIITEIIGPVATKRAIMKANEVNIK